MRYSSAMLLTKTSIQYEITLFFIPTEKIYFYWQKKENISIFTENFAV